MHYVWCECSCFYVLFEITSFTLHKKIRSLSGDLIFLCLHNRYRLIMVLSKCHVGLPSVSLRFYGLLLPVSNLHLSSYVSLAFRNHQQLGKKLTPIRNNPCSNRNTVTIHLCVAARLPHRPSPASSANAQSRLPKSSSLIFTATDVRCHFLTNYICMVFVRTFICSYPLH